MEKEKPAMAAHHSKIGDTCSNLKSFWSQKKFLRIFKLFRCAGALEWLLMTLGAVAAIVHGFILPISLFLISRITNAFVFHEGARLLVNQEVKINQDDVIALAINGYQFDRIGAPVCSQEHLALAFNPDATYISVSLRNLTGGVVNCSENYRVTVIPPFAVDFNVSTILKFCIGDVAYCLDDITFTSEMNTLIIAFTSIALLAIVLGSLQSFLFQTAAERQICQLKLRLFQAVMHQDINWFNSQSCGDVCTWLSDDIDKIHTSIGSNLAVLIQWISTFVSGVLVGFALQWKLTLVLLAITPFMVIPAGIFNRLAATSSFKEQRHYAHAGSVAEQALAAITTVFAFGGQEKECQRYAEKLSAAKRTGKKHGLMSGISIFGVYFTIFAMAAVAFWFGGYLITARLTFAGNVLAVLLAVLVGAFHLGQSSTNLGNLIITSMTAQPIFDTIDRVPSINPSSRKGETPEDCDGSVVFNGVTFAYPSRADVKVIQEFDLNVRPGQTVAVVGASGSGKSTLLNLLLRFYDVEKGKVLVGGKDVRSLNLMWLRKQIGIVRQEPVLFNKTIAENIRLGQEEATMDDIISAAKIANAHSFISKFPKGYGTLVGERGTQLSGGQKQRIAIARALVRDPKILLLDEATSALDTESEAIVQAALDRASKGRTTIVISHHLTSIQNATTIVCIDKGKPAEVGTIEDLLRNKKLCTKLAREFGAVRPHPSNCLGSSGQMSTTASLRGQRGASLRMAEEEKEEGKDVSVWEVLKLNASEKWVILMGVLGAFISGVTFPLFAMAFGEVFVVFLQPASDILNDIHFWSSIFLLMGFFIGLGQLIKTLCFSISGEYLTIHVRKRIFKAMFRQEVGWFDNEKHSTGVLTNMLAEDGSSIQGAAGARIGTLVEGATTLLAGHIIAFTYSWPLTLVLMCAVPLYILSGWVYSKASLGLTGKQKNAFIDAAEIAFESVENIETVQSLGLEDKLYNEYKEKIKTPMKHLYATAPLYGISQGILLVGYIIAFRFGAYQVIQAKDHIAYAPFYDVYKVFAALVFATVNIGLSSSLAPSYSKGKVAARRIFHLLQREPQVDSLSIKGIELKDIRGTLDIRNVFFHYPARPEATVLQGLSLFIPQGKSLALVGSSGCGKSTVVSLIERFYDPSPGSLSLDEVDIRDLNLQWLRQQIGIVSQEPILFDASIEENIRYGALFREVPEEEVVEAARAANAHDFILALPQGYSTNVGMKGAQLSGGQKQRIAIARALVRDPKILLLDEATSALDTESEAIVQAALDKAQVGRTTLIISHRLSVAKGADSIAVIQGGRAVESGTHTELISSKGFYHHLYQLQYLHLSST